MFLRSCWLVLFGFLFAACTAAAPETVMPTAMPAATPLMATSTIQATAVPTEISPTATFLPTPTPSDTATATAVPEASVIEIPISGPLSDAGAEISGLAWYGENLIFLPQYPSRFGNQLFYLPKQDILDFLDGILAGSLVPQQIPLTAPDLHHLKGYEGLEAVAFYNDQIFVTSETNGGDPMLGYLIAGEIESDLSAVRLDTAVLMPLHPQANLSNYSDETLLINGETLLTIYEANGRNVNPAPLAHQFDTSLKPIDALAFPTIEYRITDATAVDENGRFWAINYLFPGDIGKLNPAEDYLRTEFGAGSTHRNSTVVERLVEFQIEADRISLTTTPPIQLELLPEDIARNWEGIVRLDEKEGFLLATDKFPTTILAFVKAGSRE